MDIQAERNWIHQEIDKVKINNDGTFRTYYVYNFQISYRISSNSIQILRVRHNARIPKDL